MSALFYACCLVTIVLFLAWAWAKGIDNMLEEHPDYSGEDMLDEAPPGEREQHWEQDGHHTKQGL